MLTETLAHESKKGLPINSKSMTRLIQNIAVPVPSDTENPMIKGITIRLKASKKLSTMSQRFRKRRNGLNETKLLVGSTKLSVVILAVFSFDKSCVTSFLKLISVLLTVFMSDDAVDFK